MTSRHRTSQLAGPVVGLAFLLARRCSAADWLTFRGDGAHTGWAPTETAVAPLTLVWSTTLPGRFGSLTSSPSVWGCVLYVGDANGRLLAFNSSNGQFMGQFVPPSGAGIKVHATPAIAPSLARVIHAVGQHVYGLTPDLLQVWDVAVGPGPDPANPEIWNSPVVDDQADAVWIGSDKLYRIRASDGSVVDSVALQSCPTCPSQGIKWGSPTLAGNNSVVIGTCGPIGNAVYSVDRTSMSINWSVTLEGQVAAAVAYDASRGLLVVGPFDAAYGGVGGIASPLLYGIGLAGNVLWSSPLVGTMLASAPIDTLSGTGYVHTVGPGWSYRVRGFSLSAANGLPTWLAPFEFNTEMSASTEASPVLVGNSSDGIVYVSSDRGIVWGLNASDGMRRPASTSGFVMSVGGNMVNSQPTPANGMLYVSGDNGILYALASGPVSSAPCLFPGVFTVTPRPSCDGIELEWNPVATATEYVVTRSTGPGAPETPVGSVQASATVVVFSLVDTGVLPGQELCHTVRAVSGTGYEVRRAEVCGPFRFPPVTVTLSITDCGAVEIEWTPFACPPGSGAFSVSEYQVFRGTGGLPVRIALIDGGVTSYLDAAVEIQGPVWYSVQPFGAGGPLGDASSPVYVSIQVPVQTLSATVAFACDGVHVSWPPLCPQTTGALAVSGYRVFRSYFGPPELVASLDAAVTEYVDAAAAGLPSACYQVTAVTAAGATIAVSSDLCLNLTQSLRLSASTTCAGLMLSWTGPVCPPGQAFGVSMYAVFRDYVNRIGVVPFTASIFVDTNVQLYSSHRYEVRGYNHEFVPSYLDEFVADSPQVYFAPILPPLPVTASQDCSGVTVSWPSASCAPGTGVFAVTGYRVLRSTGGPTVPVAVVQPPATRYVDGSVGYGQAWCYSLEAVGPGIAGVIQSGGPACVLLPNPSVSLSVSLTCTGMALQWLAQGFCSSGTGPLAILGYNVFRALQPSGAQEVLASGLTASRFTDTGITPGLRPCYQIAAVTGSGASFFSDESCLPAIMPISITETYPSAGGATVCYEIGLPGFKGCDPADLFYPDKYQLLKQTGGDPTNFTPMGPSQSASCLTDNSCGTPDCMYEVQVLNGSKTVIGISGPVVIAPLNTTVRGLTAVAECAGDTVTLSWYEPASGAAGYRVYRSSYPGSLFPAVLTATPITALFLVDSPGPGGPWWYRVTSVDSSGSESPLAAATEAGTLVAVDRQIGWPWRGGDRAGHRNSPVDIQAGISLVWSLTGFHPFNNVPLVDREGNVWAMGLAGSPLRMNGKTGAFNGGIPVGLVNMFFTVLDPSGRAYIQESLGSAGGALSGPGWTQAFPSGARRVPLMIGRDGLLWVEGRDLTGPPFLVGLRPEDGSEVWRVEHAEDSLFFPAMDCRKPSSRLFLGGGGNQTGLPASVSLQSFTFTQIGSAPTVDPSYTAGITGLGGQVSQPAYSNTFFSASSFQVVTPWIPTVETTGRSVLFGGRVVTYSCTTYWSSTSSQTTCFGGGVNTVLLFNATGSPPLGMAPTKNVSSFGGYPSTLAETVNAQPPIVYRSPVDGHEHGSLVGRDADLQFGSMGSFGLPGAAVSANKWTVQGATIRNMSGAIVASYPTAEHFVCPPTIGLDGFWYVVDLSGRLYAFDVPALPEGPLPPEEP